MTSVEGSEAMPGAGRRPVSSSNSMTPAANTSARPSTSPPRICSGDA